MRPFIYSIAGIFLLAVVAPQARAQQGLPTYVTCSVGVAAAPIALVKGDFNNDGNPDIAALNGSSSQVLVLLTDRNQLAFGDCLGGVASTAIDIGTPGAAALAAGDVDANAITDLVVGTPAGVVILRGNGTGGFTADSAPLPAGSDPRALAIADLDGDGRADIIVGNGNGNSVTILYGATAGFASPVSIDVNGPVTSMVVADLNKDSFLDIAAVSNLTGAITVFLQESNSPAHLPRAAPTDGRCRTDGGGGGRLQR